MIKGCIKKVKENIVSNMVDELTVRKMELPSGIYSSSSTNVKEKVNGKKEVNNVLQLVNEKKIDEIIESVKVNLCIEENKNNDEKDI